MPKRLPAFLLAVLLPLPWLGCASSAAPTEPDMQSLDAIGDLMVDVVDKNYTEVLLREVQRDPEDMDLAAVAGAANTTAGVIGRLHGALVLASVPDFAQMARDAEAELRGIAADAAAGRRPEVKQRILRLEARHCDRCHAAAEHAGR